MSIQEEERLTKSHMSPKMERRPRMKMKRTSRCPSGV
jgi:hypothetical protein